MCVFILTVFFNKRSNELTDTEKQYRLLFGGSMRVNGLLSFLFLKICRDIKLSIHEEHFLVNNPVGKNKRQKN